MENPFSFVFSWSIDGLSFTTVVANVVPLIPENDDTTKQSLLLLIIDGYLLISDKSLHPCPPK